MKFVSLFVFVAACSTVPSSDDLALDLGRPEVDFAEFLDLSVPPDLTPPPDLVGACNSLLNGAPPVGQTILAAPMPSPSCGGTIASGTYFLTSSTVYSGGATSPATLRATWSISSNVLERAQSLNGGADRRDSFTISTAGTTLSLTGTCGGSGNGSFGYDFVVGDAGASQLVEYVDLAKVVNVYTLQ